MIATLVDSLTLWAVRFPEHGDRLMPNEVIARHVARHHHAAQLLTVTVNVPDWRVVDSADAPADRGAPMA